jgi:hypothetical protein
MPFPDLDQESRSGILVYLIRGSLVKEHRTSKTEGKKDERILNNL